MSAGSLDASARSFGRVVGKFGRVGEMFWTRRREVLTRRLAFFDASAVNLVAPAKELSPCLYPCRSSIVQNISLTHPKYFANASKDFAEASRDFTADVVTLPTRQITVVTTALQLLQRLPVKRVRLITPVTTCLIVLI